ncbi:MULTISPECIES: BTAD domain-containing putative transcriptional regulator [unclassified Nocardia]|uniref:AfsR/SARP family transcriptional regulator n=1 Tax=unclassified Nocardia TaxID=2637762 RepID=UPI001CE3C3AB|nr:MULTISPECIES: BTAD domain-containing putative transcriptional regulator [unclassified Nocardia]
MATFRVLGPVEVVVGGSPIDLGHARQRSALAVLLVEVGRPVSVDVLIDRLWGERPPTRARETVRGYASRLRRVLETVDVPLRRRTGGYVIEAVPAAVDVYHFRRLAEDARRVDDDVRAADLFGQALQLWRGTPFSGLDSPWLAEVADRWEAEHIAVQGEWIDRMLRAGRHPELIGVLPTLVAERPLDERLLGQWIDVLRRNGRQAEALQVFHDLRVRLAEELGVDPGSQLQQQYQSILRGSPIPTTERPTRQIGRKDIPRDIPDFTGREPELARLMSVLGQGDDNATTGGVVTIDGMAGVGKTALAVHAAHRLADRCPDAHLYIDLCGHSEHDSLDPMTALDALLRAIGVPGQIIPATLDRRASLWRAETAGHSMLLVLDNAADSSQVRPLLPGAGTCVTLVTSRRRLTDLEGARALSIDVLSAEEAIGLFIRIVDDARGIAERTVVAEVTALCGQLPLAIRLAASRLRARPAWTVRHLLDRLRNQQRRLGELAVGDRSVAAAFTLSYQHLDPEQRRVFRLLGLVRGPDIDIWAASSLAAIGLDAAERLLESLVDAHLLEQPRPGRYRFHDLLRDHAHATMLAEETPDSRRQCGQRLVDFYLHTAYAGDRLLRPTRILFRPGIPSPGCHPRPLPDHTATFAWFDAEHLNVTAAQELAITLGLHQAVWQLASTLRQFHCQRGHLSADLAVCRAGMAAADELGDPIAQAHAHRFLGQACSTVGLWEEMREHLEQALALDEQTSDLAGQAHTHHLLGCYWDMCHGDPRRALQHAAHALRLFQNLGRSDWEGEELNSVAWFFAHLGDYDRARTDATTALELCRRHRNRLGEAMTLDTLGYIAHHTGDHANALTYYQQALAIDRELGMEFGLTATLDQIGHTYQALGRPDRTLAVWQEALELFQSQHRQDDAERMAKQMAALGYP